MSKLHVNPVSHLMFMDDLKIYEENEERLEATVGIFDEVAVVLGIELGLKKCAVAYMSGGRGGDEGSPEVAKRPGGDGVGHGQHLPGGRIADQAQAREDKKKKSE